MEGFVVAQVVAALFVLSGIFTFLYQERGLNNLTRDLRKNVETENDDLRESGNFDERRRALNLDKFEEIYDSIINDKRDETHTDIFTKIDIKNSQKYHRRVSVSDAHELS